MQFDGQVDRRLGDGLSGLGGPDAAGVHPTVTGVEEDRAVVVPVGRAEGHAGSGGHVRRERLGAGGAGRGPVEHGVTQLR